MNKVFKKSLLNSSMCIITVNLQDFPIVKPFPQERLEDGSRVAGPGLASSHEYNQITVKSS